MNPLEVHVLRHTSFLYYYTTVLEIKECKDHMLEGTPELKQSVMIQMSLLFLATSMIIVCPAWQLHCANH